MTVCQGVSLNSPMHPEPRNFLPGLGSRLEPWGAMTQARALLPDMRSPSSLQKPATPPLSPSPLAQVLGFVSPTLGPHSLPKFFCSGHSHLCFGSCPGTQWQLIRSRKVPPPGLHCIASRLKNYHSLPPAQFHRPTQEEPQPDDSLLSLLRTVTRGASSSSWGVTHRGNSRAWVQRHHKGQSFCSSAPRKFTQSLKVQSKLIFLSSMWCSGR